MALTAKQNEIVEQAKLLKTEQTRLYAALGKARDKVAITRDKVVIESEHLTRVQTEIEEVLDAQATLNNDLDTIARALLLDALGIEVIYLKF